MSKRIGFLLSAGIIASGFCATAPAQAHYNRVASVWLKHNPRSIYATLYVSVEDGYGVRIQSVSVASSNYIHVQGPMNRIKHSNKQNCRHENDPFAGCAIYTKRIKVGKGHKGPVLDGNITATLKDSKTWTDKKKFRLHI